MISSTGGATLVRVMTAVVLLPLVVVLIWAPGLEVLFVLFVAALIGVGVFEYFGMVRALGIEGERTGVLIVAVGMCLAAAFPRIGLSFPLNIGLFLVMALHLARPGPSLKGAAVSVMGVVYLGWLPAHFVALHGIEGVGPGLVTIVAVAIILSDTCAYFVGKAIGRHKLAPTLSPNKTWEGAIGGVVFATAGTAAVYALRQVLPWDVFPAWPLWLYAFAGAGLSALGQVGDMTESMLKRDSSIKDSGSIFPGHGGVLDRCDGFLFAAPVLYYLHHAMAQI